MSYTIKFTETNNADKLPITIQDGTVDNTTSLTLVGKNYTGYGQIIAGDFLHLLENFANSTAPSNPVQGQLWFDNSTGINLLYAFDGSTWNAVGSVKKSGTAPSNSNTGDLWVDTINSQLYLYSGSSFVLVGPQFSSGLQSGPIIETIVDTSNVSHTVTTIYATSTITTATSYRMMIVSKDTFTPKSAILGFTTINEGINLSNVNATNADSLTRFWGTAQQADALLVGTTAVPAANFLRNDVTSIANYPINVRNDGGITIGSGLGFNLGINGSTTVFYSRNSGNAIEFSTNNAGTIVTGLHLNANARLGVGPNNTSPQSALDVIGGTTIKDDPSTQAISWTSNTIVVLDTYITSDNYYYQVTTAGTTGSNSPSGTTINGTETNGTAVLTCIGNIPTSPVPGRLIITGTTDIGTTSGSPFDPGGASIQTAGGLSVSKSATIGTTLSVGGTITGITGAINVGADSNSVAILPSENLAYDIGTDAQRFRNVYAETFNGSFSGSFTGTVTGNVSGSAAKLTSPTIFSLAGDVTSTQVVFNGQTQTGSAIFDTAISSSLITQKTIATESALNDQLLVFQASSNQLVSMTKQVLLNHVATVPIGSVFPFAGLENALPTGYLLCDGSEVQISKYPALFSVIQYIYKPSALLNGLSTFALPDLRGRFALGADNMDNGLTVPSQQSATTLINAGGGTANRVSSVTADSIGASAGSQNITLSSDNLPDHKHNLSDGYQQFYAVGTPGWVPGNDENQLTNIAPGLGLATSSQVNQGFGLSDSGSVSVPTLASSTPVTVMNPYLTINYIIFTGVI
jgi:microcystin-dependent protein